ncbi:MAG: DUF6599 family protein [Pseudomonadota bacterium]
MPYRYLTRASSLSSLCAALLLAPAVAARMPEFALDAREGVWLGAGDRFVHQARDRFSVFAAPDQVNALAADGRTIWIATDDGVVRFESESRRAGTLSMDEGLPSQAVSSVVVDDAYVWFGTNKGLVRYRKVDRSLRVYGEAEGLPHRAVNDLLLVGRQVWVATRAGLAVYDPDVDGLRPYGAEQGLGGDEVLELFRFGDDLWAVTDQGLSRYRVATRQFTNLSHDELGGLELGVFVPDGERIWIGHENGLVSFETASDTLVPFVQQSALEGRRIVGVETFTDYLFIATDRELVQVHKDKRTIRRFTAADGLAREAGALGTVLNGGRLLLLFEDGAEVYDIQRDLWLSRSLEVTEGQAEEDAHRVTWQLQSSFDAEMPADLTVPELGDERFATLTAGAGLGYQGPQGRALDLSANLDYGELELPGIRDRSFHGEYLAAPGELLREVQIDDMHRVQGIEEGLERPFTVEGGGARLEARSKALQVEVDGGLSRGLSVREVLTGVRQEIYSLSNTYVIPLSERVYVDGELLIAGTDYTLIYPAGQLAFLDPERVDDLSVIEVEYEVDLVPKKGLGVVSILDLVPADREVGGWVRSGQPTLVNEETGLYAQIDGAAPKYIDRGWVRSVYAEYRQASRTLALAIHDMGDADNARELYDYDLPPAREPVAERPDMVLDVGLASSYAVKALSQSYYVELSIDDKTDAAKQSIKLFALQVVERGEKAGAHEVDALRELIVQSRLALRPVDGVELGARALTLQGLEDPTLDATPRRLWQSAVDGRLERSLGQRGQVVASGEAAASQDLTRTRNPGWAALGRVRLSHPYVEGSAQGRYQSEDFAPVMSDRTLYGRLHDEERLNATAYPARWLPTSLFYSRQISRLDDGAQTAAVEHLIGRVQLAHEALPATTLQLGHSRLDDGQGANTRRLRAVAQTEYDLATGLLSFLNMKRFLLRGLYGYSEADRELDCRRALSSTEALAGADGNCQTPADDRVETSRLEAKLAPTGTESGYALFRSRAARSQREVRQPFELAAYHWELNAGARSAFVPGLIPQLNYAVLYDDLRDLDTEDSERSSQGSVSARLGVFPGEWFSPLTPVVLDTRYALGHDERATSGLRSSLNNLHRVDNRMAYNGLGRFELELYQLYEVALQQADQLDQRHRLELRNRAVYRPVYTSPVTVRWDLVLERTRNDLDLAPTARDFGELLGVEAGLEWLMRWSTMFATKLKTTYAVAETRDLVQLDPVSLRALELDFRQHQLTPELELRLLWQGADSSLFLLQRDRVFYMFGQGEGAVQSVGFEVSLGAIWKLGDNLYLDGDVAYRHAECLAEPCTPVREIRPRLLLSAKL